MRIEVTNVGALVRVLDNFKMEYSVIDDTHADIFDKVNITQLTLALVEEKCEVLSLTEKEESLESYYVSLVGGGRNE